MIKDDLIRRMLEFRRERDWEQFHNLRTLSTSIVLEAAELAEVTQWARDDDLPAITERKRERIEQEVADIAILLSYDIHDLDIDLDRVVAKKLLLNAEKYPVSQAKGNAKKYDEF